MKNKIMSLSELNSEVLTSFIDDWDTDMKEVDLDGFVKVYAPKRASKVGATRKVAFGRKPTPSPGAKECGFFCHPDDQSNPKSIYARDWLAVSDLKKPLAALPNLASYVLGPHYMLLPWNAPETGAARFSHVLQNALDADLLEVLINISRQLGDQWCLLYNSLHAGASQNHLHVHLVFHPMFPVEHCLAVAGPTYRYLLEWPVGTAVFEGNEMIDPILKLNALAVPFNFFIRGQRTILFGGRVDHELVAECPGVAIAICERLGRFLISDPAVFERVNHDILLRALIKSTLSVEPLHEFIA